MKKFISIAAFLMAALSTGAHANQNLESVARQTRMSMMDIVNRSMDSGMCSLPATRTLRSAVSKMDELMKDGDFKAAVDVAYETHKQVSPNCGHKYSLAGMGSVTYAGTYNKMDGDLETSR